MISHTAAAAAAAAAAEDDGDHARVISLTCSYIHARQCRVWGKG